MINIVNWIIKLLESVLLYLYLFKVPALIKYMLFLNISALNKYLYIF